MILKADTKEINYLENWPQHYYEIADSVKRKEVLLTAIEQKLDPKQDALRLKLYEKRYGLTKKKNANTDIFIHAWMMIKASNAAGVSRFQKKQKQKELRQLMKDLGILDFPEAPKEEQEIIKAEWACFTRLYINYCTNNKTYCSTLFGFIPIKEEIVAEKLADEIDLVTRRYPKVLDLADSFIPFRKVVSEVYLQMVENGQKYWTNPENGE